MGQYGGKFREAQIIANAKSNLEWSSLNQKTSEATPRRQDITLSKCHPPWNINVKQMHLAEASYEGSIG